MELNLIEKLTLLALDDEKGTLVADSTIFSYAIGASVLLELLLNNKIDISKSKIHVVDKKKTDNSILDNYLNILIDSTKEKSLSNWIEIFGNKAKQIKLDTIDNLIKANILTKKEQRFLWVFNTHKYPTQNAKPENELRKRINEIILNDKKPTLNEVLLISLIDSCGINKEVFGDKYSKEAGKKIKLITNNNTVAKAIHKSIEEVYNTLIAVITVIT